MSKIIIDQVQKNGGTALTLPASDGTANAPLVTDGAGNLSFAPNKMPTADGTANKPVVTDGSGQLSFSPVGLPTADGADGEYMITDGAGQLSFVALADTSRVPNEGAGVWGTVITTSARQNVYSTGEWSSSGPWTTYYHSDMTDSTSVTQAWNMFLGDGMPTGSSEYFYSHDDGGGFNRQAEYANNKRVGHLRRDFYYDDNASTGNDYSGCSWRVLPIRNTTANQISCTINTYCSTGSGNYGGGSLSYFRPSSATASAGSTVSYEDATGGSWSNIENYTNNNITRHLNGSITIPAHTTVLVMLNSSHLYQTTHRYKDTNEFYNLDTTFSTGLVCDLKMLDALQKARSSSNSQTSANPHQLYNWCADQFGSR
jgi:hypothetical protein